MAAQREWFEKDYYKVLGVAPDADAKTITKAYVYGDSAVGFSDRTPTGQTVTLTLQGSTDNFSSSVVDLGNTSFADPENNSQKTVTATDTSTAYRYHRIKIDTAEKSIYCSELEFWGY